MELKYCALCVLGAYGNVSVGFGESRQEAERDAREADEYTGDRCYSLEITDPRVGEMSIVIKSIPGPFDREKFLELLRTVVKRGYKNLDDKWNNSDTVSTDHQDITMVLMYLREANVGIIESFLMSVQNLPSAITEKVILGMCAFFGLGQQLQRQSIKNR